MLMNEYTFFYIEANIFSIIISLILFFREVKNVDKQLRNIELLKSIFVYVLFYIADILCALQQQECESYMLLQKITVFFQLSTFAYGSYQWYIYSEVSQGNAQIYTKKNKIKWGMPVFILIAVFFVYLIVLSFNDHQAAYYMYANIIHGSMICIVIFYEALTSVRAFRRAYKNKNNTTLGSFIFLGISPLVFCSFIILQAIFITIPIFCFLNTIWMICFYLRGIDDLISIDALTKLNNRNQLRKYFHQLQHDSKYKNYLLVIDIDHFKMINDKYGHLEGDKALVIVADTFRTVCGLYPYKIFISRYGGDEFVIIAQAAEPEDIRTLKHILNEKLAQNSANKGLPYTLQISTGFTLITQDCRNMAQFIEQADKEMYIEKESKYSK